MGARVLFPLPVPSARRRGAGWSDGRRPSFSASPRRGWQLGAAHRPLSPRAARPSSAGAAWLPILCRVVLVLARLLESHLPNDTHEKWSIIKQVEFGGGLLAVPAAVEPTLDEKTCAALDLEYRLAYLAGANLCWCTARFRRTQSRGGMVKASLPGSTAGTFGVPLSGSRGSHTFCGANNLRST